MTSLKYDVALSFTGEDRRFAEMLAEELKKRGIKVFYDKYEKATIWGKDLYSHLSYVYQKQAQFCVIFLSESYANKLWTNLECQSAQARALEENREYILPIRLDDSEIPGFLPTTAYLNWADESVDTIAEAIVTKLDPGYEGIAEAKGPSTKGTPKRNIDPEKFSWNSLSPIY